MSFLFELHLEKIFFFCCFVFSFFLGGGVHQVRHNPACTATKASYRLELLDIGSKKILLSRQLKKVQISVPGSTADLQLWFCI